MAESRRPRRHCAARRTAAPSAVHYVGYVEDDETPEMIMKKFEELEKVCCTSIQPLKDSTYTFTPLDTFSFHPNSADSRISFFTPHTDEAWHI